MQEDNTIQIFDAEEVRTLVLQNLTSSSAPNLIERENEVESREDSSTCLDSNNTTDRPTEKACVVTDSAKP